MNVLLLDDIREVDGVNPKEALSGGGLQGNLGMEYVAAAARECGHEVAVAEPPLTEINDSEIMNLVGSSDVVAMSSMTWNAPRVIALANRIKKEFPKILLAVGGIGPTCLPEFYQPHFDAVFAGEGEQTFPDWLKKAAPAGIIKASRNLDWTGDQLPIRDSKVMKKSRMRGIWPIPYKDQLVTNILYGRGCYGNCYFCSSPKIWERKIVWQDPQSVATELLMLAENYGVNSVDFIDATFNSNPQKVIDLCNELIRQKVHLKIKWGAMISPSKWMRADEVFAAMSEAGCIKVGVGIEDPISEMRKKLNKSGSNIEKCHEVLNLAAKLMLARVFIIIGSPGQTDENILAIQDMLKTWPIDELRISIFCPFPGTRAWMDLQHLIIEKDFSKYDTNHPIIKSFWSNDELYKIHRSLMENFYRGPMHNERKVKRISPDMNYDIGYRQFEENFLRPRGYVL